MWHEFVKYHKMAAAVNNNTCLTKLDLHENDFMGPQRLAAIPTITDTPARNLSIIKKN